MIKILYLIIISAFLSSCKKNEEFTYKENYYGNYNFNVITKSRDQYLTWIIH